MTRSEEDVSPPWGSLPVEQYLLSKWDSTSTLSTEQQRNQLVQEFIQENDISAFASASLDDSPPTGLQELIQTVLVPWRPQKLRRIAEKYDARSPLFEKLVVLRTYYADAGDNNKIRRWIDDAAASFEDSDPSGALLGDPDDRWWRVLDDAALFDMGPQRWQSVYNVLPELATPAIRRGFDNEDVEAVKETMSAVLGSREPEEDDYEDAVAIVAVAGCWLLVLDEQAFEDEEMLLIFRDKKGNVIRQSAIQPDDVQQQSHYILRGSITESGFWTEAEVGKKYKPRGQMMRTVLPVVMAGSE